VPPEDVCIVGLDLDLAALWPVAGAAGVVVQAL
jgi:hypothetical protein